MGVYGAAGAARKALAGDSRAWLAGDLGVDLREPLTQEQAEALKKFETLGVKWTLVSTAMTMAASDQSADPAFISVKAVDPRSYPFYGAITLSSGAELRDMLAPDTAAVSSEVLERLDIKLGDTFQIAGQPFRAVALITAEPDRFSGSFGLGLRSIVSREGYARTSIADSGISTNHRVLLRLPDGFNPRVARQFLTGYFPGGAMREYRTAYGRQVDTTLNFLSVASFLALMIGAIGVWISVHQHAAESMSKLATVKILGAGSGQTSGVFLAQVITMTLAAAVIAIPIGMGIGAGMLAIIRRYLALPPAIHSDTGAILKATFASVAAIAGALVEPTDLIRRLRPAVMLRHAEIAHIRFTRWTTVALSFGIGIFASVLLAVEVLGSWPVAALLIVGLAASIGVCWLLAGFALKAKSRFTFHASWLRLGIACLDRSTSRARLLIAALAAASLTMVATFETRGEVTAALSELLPSTSDSLYIARFRDSERKHLSDFLKQQPGVESVRFLTQTKLRLTGIVPRENGRAPLFVNYTAACESPEFFSALEKTDYPRPESHRFLWGIAPIPEDAPNNRRLPSALIADFVAKDLEIFLGSKLKLETQSQTIWVEATHIRKLTPAERVWSTLHVDCSGLDQSTLIQQAAIVTKPNAISSIRRALMTEFPAFAIITAADIEGTAEGVSHDAVLLVRTVAWLTMGSGVLILFALIAASRTSRLRETGVLLALGARRRTLIAMYTIEFAFIGLIAGLIAALLTTGFSTLVLSLTFGEFYPAHEWRTALAVVGASALLTVIAGWLPTLGMLNRKPMAIFRELRLW